MLDYFLSFEYCLRTWYWGGMKDDLENLSNEENQ